MLPPGDFSHPARFSLTQEPSDSEQNYHQISAAWVVRDNLMTTPASLSPLASCRLPTESPQHLSPATPEHPRLPYFFSEDAIFSDNLFAQMTSDPQQVSLAPSHLHISEVETKQPGQRYENPWDFQHIYHRPYEMDSLTPTILNRPTSPSYYEYPSHTMSNAQTSYSHQYRPESVGDCPWSSISMFSPDGVESQSARGVLRYDYEDEDEETFCDKPYARLIYEALLQAPGRRMMLQEIYEWFQVHTTKPRESGTNGWQNSIRHNLSMNKAFENDKNESSSVKGQSRKANSVWILAEDAIRNGVQSTTRYRKTGSTKRSLLNRVPALQRQRSGAKGGRAARRAARLRCQEQTSSAKSTSALTSTSTGSYSGCTPANVFKEYSPMGNKNPSTPPDYHPFAHNTLMTGDGYMPEGQISIKSELEGAMGDDLRMQPLPYQPPFDLTFCEILRLQNEDTLPGNET